MPPLRGRFAAAGGGCRIRGECPPANRVQRLRNEMQVNSVEGLLVMEIIVLISADM